MDPFIAGIAIHEAVRQKASHHNREHHMDREHYMDLYNIQEYSRIRHEERLKWAANEYAELSSPLTMRFLAFARRAIKAVLAVRISRVNRTQEQPRAIAF